MDDNHQTRSRSEAQRLVVHTYNRRAYSTAQGSWKVLFEILNGDGLTVAVKVVFQGDRNDAMDAFQDWGWFCDELNRKIPHALGHYTAVQTECPKYYR